MSIPIKLLISCNLKPGIEETKLALVYLTQEFSAKMQEAGLQRVDVWYTVYGTWPQLRASFMCPDADEMHAFLHSTAWAQLKLQFLKYIQDYHQKIVIFREQFQF